MPTVSAPVRATLLMLAAVSVSGLQNSLMRLIADQGIHAFQITLFRNVFGLVSVAAIMLWAERGVPRTRWFWAIFFSCILHVASMLTFIHGLTLLPLNESAALSFAAPLFVTIGAALFLGETVRARRWSAVAAGFVGVLIILRPGVVPVSFGAGMILLSCMLGAAVTLMFKNFAGHERPLTLIFYQCMIASVFSVPGAAWVWVTPDRWQFLALASIGLIGTLGWLAFLRACRLVDASAIQPIEFVKLPSVAFFAYLMFGETPDEWVWLGAAVIFGSNLYIAHREAIAHRRTAARASRDR
ncbi:MAG: DMT family transporter [Alphaproteobacteria bacterium]|nr:DMT family transporter [Alphaproteobacteria bacterium]